MNHRKTIYTLLAASVASTFLVGAAQACGNECGPVHAVPTGDSSAAAKAAQQQQQQQQALGGAGGAVTMAPISNTAGGPQSQSFSDATNTNSRAWALGLAPIAKTPPMAPIPCGGATITQSAIGIAFGAFSHADSKADGSDCTLANLRNAKVEACQYASAKQIEDLMVAKHLPAYQPTPNNFRDWSVQECHALRNPPPVIKEVVREVVVEAQPKPHPLARPTGTPCAKPGGVRNADGLCYYPKADPWAKCQK